VLGSGTPLRQFCFTPDLCHLLLWQLLRKEPLELVSLVPEEEHSIKELAETIGEVYNVKDKI